MTPSEEKGNAMAGSLHFDRGLVHIYAGDGKGKTTAAVGLAVRARGAGCRVGFFQFMKGRPTAELAMLEALGIDVARGSDKAKFVFQMGKEEKLEYAREQDGLLRDAAARAGEYDLIVLDELASAISTGMASAADAAAFLDGRPAGLEVVITGRDPAEELLSRAQYVSEVRCVRHPYDQGVAARRGIEF